ncbi:MAG: hypothetical protein ACLU4J_12920 [Butyricimonas paravirosa]
MRLEAVAFDTCSLVEAEFSRTSLKDGLNILTVGSLRWCGVTCVIVSPVQALDLTRYLGLVVKDV